MRRESIVTSATRQPSSPLRFRRDRGRRGIRPGFCTTLAGGRRRPWIVYPSSTALTTVPGVSALSSAATASCSVGSKRLPSASIGRTRKRSNASVSRRLRRLRSATLPAARLLADRSKRALQVVGDGQELARKIRDRGLPRLAVSEQ
jgi:hypothetical protein